MKVEIPDHLKAEVPHTVWGRILSATPVVMAVVATMLAGLSSSEMTRAQYARSLAAQQQSKAGDQWSFFQAKRQRAVLQRNTIDLLQATGDIRPLDPALTTDAAVAAALTSATLPALPPAAELDTCIAPALAAAEQNHDLPKCFWSLKEEVLTTAIRSAQDRAKEFDKLTGPITAAIAALERDRATREFIAARLRYSAARYDAEAKLNQAVAQLYELQVRRSNFTAERHHGRSQKFFYGMLAAQAAVIISTFAIAARQRNFLWTIAAVAGLLAVLFAVYVYLYV